ncbi:expressed unknown protein [Seminavis robusta]|uniref:Uncharacterized protein n=1 Tax=Seminavis robusta TaxID=568900 RepID=A0A9N8ET33_9STRA|nr:expressed unknown protein [Seminavis robusta]|eukprot:Sro1692_g291520.1 n/a (343) ;mRNA; f:11977-13005
MRKLKVLPLWVLVSAHAVKGGISHLPIATTCSAKANGSDMDVKSQQGEDATAPLGLALNNEGDIPSKTGSGFGPALISRFGRPLAEFGRDVALGQSVDYREIFQSGGAAELLFSGAMFLPARLLRSSLLGWAVAEAIDRRGYYFYKGDWNRKKKESKGKRYKRVTTEYRTTKTVTKGLITESEDPDFEFEKRRPAAGIHPQSKKAPPTSTVETFDALVPESQKSTNLLAKSDKERIVEGFEWKERGGKRYKVRRKKKKKKKLSIAWTRKNQFAVLWALGHVFSPLLWLTPIGGWLGVLFVSAELVQRVELKDNELFGLIEPFRGDPVKAVLFGSIVGAVMSF